MALTKVTSGTLADDAVTSDKLSGSINITTGNSLTIDSGATITNNGTASGFGGGKVLQVVSTTTGTSVSLASSSWTDLGTDFDLTITPSSASSKILIMCCIGFLGGTNQQNNQGGLKIMRDDTVDLWPSGSTGTLSTYDYGASGVSINGYWPFNWLDSPATTSAVTYSLYGKETTGVDFRVNDSADITSIVAMEIGA